MGHNNIKDNNNVSGTMAQPVSISGDPTRYGKNWRKQASPHPRCDPFFLLVSLQEALANPPLLSLSCKRRDLHREDSSWICAIPKEHAKNSPNLSDKIAQRHTSPSQRNVAKISRRIKFSFEAKFNFLN